MPLCEVTPELTKLRKLLPSLDAFRGHRNVQVAGHAMIAPTMARSLESVVVRQVIEPSLIFTLASLKSALQGDVLQREY